MKNLYNPTDKDVTVWYGHTPYFVPAKGLCEVEDTIAEVALAHNDYSFLKAVPLGGMIDEVDPEAEGKAGEQAGEGQAGGGEQAREEVLTYPWSSTEWNPLEAPWEEIVQYAGIHNIKLSDNPAFDRQNVDEHFLASME